MYQRPPSNSSVLFDIDSTAWKLANNREQSSRATDTQAVIPNMWEILLKKAAGHGENLKMVISTFRLFASSGEEVSVKNIFLLYNIADRPDVTFEYDYELLLLIFILIWTEPAGKQDYQIIIASLLFKHIPQIIRALQVPGDRNEM